MANRISYLLNWHGPSEAIDTACSSALVAIHRAVRALQLGECNLAIAGGVSLMVVPETFVATSQLGVLSPDGCCKTFDKSANGYVKGEGIGAILLKPLKKALTDGDVIYGIIRGSAENHGGKAQSLTAPNSVVQAQLLEQAYRVGAIDPATITYIETHGTGTVLGDPAEIEGIKLAFSKFATTKNKVQYCGLGSVKTNIGHLEPAAGIAGVIKVLLAMRHGKLPGTVHLTELNPYIDIKESPFYIVDKTKAWEHLKDVTGNNIPQRAGVSSFGFGGSYAHVVLEEAPKRDQFQMGNKPAYLITLSAKSEASLKQKVTDLQNWLQVQSEPVSLIAISYTLNTGRAHFDKRVAIMAATCEELSKKLASLQKGQVIDGCFRGDASKKPDDAAIYAKVLNTTLNDLRSRPIQNAKEYKINLTALANLYVKGYDLDWALLHQGGI